MKTNKELISEYLKRSIQTKKDLLKTKVEIIDHIVKEVISAYKKGNKIVWFGNGGSAADAQHLACELVCKFNLDRKSLPSIALTTNTSELTAIANDYDFDQVFARQVESMVNPGDIVIGLTTSGSSQNIIEGINEAKRRKATTIVFTGASEARFKNNHSVDYLLTVPSKVTSHVQECHITIGHIVCYLVEKELF